MAEDPSEEKPISQPVEQARAKTGEKHFPEDSHAPQSANNQQESVTENMEVHHHSHSHGKKNWKAYFWEFLMLFLAVFCGFLAEYQLEHKIERDREKQFIQTLIADLSEDTLMFSNLIPSIQSNVKRCDTLIHLLNAADLKAESSDLYHLGRRATRIQWININDRTIQQMKNSGGFRLIRNDKATKAIIEYYNQVGFIEMLQSIDLEEQNEYKRTAVEIFNPVIFDSIVQSHEIIIRPAGNPSLFSDDPKLLARLSGMVSYLKGSRLSLMNAEEKMKESAKSLALLLKKEYHLK